MLCCVGALCENNVATSTSDRCAPVFAALLRLLLGTITPDMNCEYSLLSTTNSDSQPYSRGIGSSPSLVKDEAKGKKEQSAVNVSDTVTALQKMQP